MMRQKAESRKERIMREALLLFAENGYIDTSTKIIAQRAGVSEALIFKHFGNKDNLLSHLIKSGYRRVLQHHRGMMIYRDAKSFLRSMINLPKELVNEDPVFWKMQERLSHHGFSKQQHELFIKPVYPAIRRAFTELGYEDPESETQLLLLIIEILWKKEANGELNDSAELGRILEGKYGLQP
ncbi:TetR/AcrR family transcriptional regulator [Parapedobacter soli]|uniref:TetR/AcrR family transcriptional regulator n=1 Tax=Parapedobacter soli TaxID=416955 RepID=UPI0021C606F1|nr:TetR/AcrR family transcriptional regulator [Parapedobacter soli]